MKYKKYLSILSVSIFAVSALMFGSVHSASAGFWDWSGIWGDSQQAQVNSPTYTGGPSLSNTFLSSSSSAQPLVTVLQPNGGEVCKVGSVCRISWAYKNIPMTSNYLAINLLKGNKEVFNIFTSKLSDISESPNYDWLIPSNINNTDVTNGGDDYKIKVVVFDYTTGQTQALDYSDNFFSIIGNSSSSSSSSSPSTSGTLTAITGGLDHLSADATVLNGTVINPNKENVSYYFHYSKDDPSSAQVIETNWTSINYSSLQNVSAYISGLSSGTKYVYRLYAYSHTTGKVVSGELKYFTTLSSSSSSSVNYSYITVINPNGGQVIKNANTVISWSITPFSSKNFGINLLYDNDDLAANIRTCNSLSLTNTDGTYHFYNWKAGFDANNQEIPNGKYKILVYDCAGGTVSGYGNSFDLISLSSSSSSSSLTSNNTNTYRQTSNYTSSSSQEISLSQLVELFIALGIISPDKANFARASVKAAR